MGENSEIAWCDDTFNPWEGCEHVSDACDFCYAEIRANRFHHDVWGKDKPRLMRSDAYWREPLKWDRDAAAAGVRRRVFCASLADVFEDHPDVTEARTRLWALIEATPNLDWLLLTKRPQNVLEMVPWWWHSGDAMNFAGQVCYSHEGTWPKNVWIGTTAENQRYLNVRMRHLARIPAPVRFLSMEPLLGPVDLSVWIDDIDWVIVGGEANHKDSRPMNSAWVRGIFRQCEERTIACPNDTDGDGNCAACARPSQLCPEVGRHSAPIPTFFKQWGDWTTNLGPLDVWRDDPDLWVNDNDATTVPVDDPALATGSWTGAYRLGKKRLKDRPFDGVERHAFPTPMVRG